MKAAIGSREWGAPDVLRLEEAESPNLKQHQVRLRVRAAGVNFADSRLRSLGGKVLGDERCVRRRIRDIRRRRASFFLDLGEQPGLNRGGRALLLRMIVGETAGLEDYGAQLGDVAATRVIKVHERKAGSGHRILQERDRRCPRQAMLAAQMQNSADKAVAAVSVIITAARPMAVVAKMLEHQVEQLHPLCDLGFQHWFECS